VVAADDRNITGTPIYVGDSSADAIERLGDRLRGAIVLAHRPQAEFLREDRMQPSDGTGPVATGNPPFPGPSNATPTQKLLALLQANRAGVVLKPAATEHGTVRVQGSRDTSDSAVPTVVLAAEQYNMLVRLVEAGVRFDLRVELGARFHDEVNTYNVLAEIPGTDPKLRNEVVLVGAHLDSWHTATGATDNADGVASAMEAMRLLTSLGARPRRTIRVALWGGEEQGLLGARAYVKQHLASDAARSTIAVYLNDDPGTGRTYAFYMQKNEAAKRIFDAWLEPLRDLGVKRNVIEDIGSTDHVPFDEVRSSCVYCHQRLPQLRRSHASHERRLCRRGQGRRSQTVGRRACGGRLACRDARRTNPAAEAMMRRRLSACVC
jgi:hypothetical protein